MSLEDQLARLNENLEVLNKNILPLLLSITNASEAETPAPAEAPKKTAKNRKPPKTKTAKGAEPEKTEEFDRKGKLNGIVEFIKSSLKGADDVAAVQAKVTEVRGEFGVELVGDLADEQLEDFDVAIRKALA